MRSFKSLLSIFVLVAGGFMFGVFGTHAEPASNNLIIERFPTEVGNSWDYKRTFYIVIYDTADGHIIEEDLYIDSLHCEFLRIDTLRGWECDKYSSQLFEDGNTYSDTVWYAHPDTAFLEIAYTPPTHAGPPWKASGKLRLKFGERYFNSIDELKLYLYQMRKSRFANTSSDTTFWDPPKKLFIFPLMVGKQWISMMDPWKEEREVAAEEVVQVPAGDFSTLRIDIRPDVEGLLLYQWISEQGVIKDSADFDTALAIDEFGEVIGYMVGYDKYELVGYGSTEVGDENSDNIISVDFSLGQNYPNPFNPNTVIRFSLSVASPTNTTLRIYNVLGQEMRSLMNEQKGAGSYEVIWDGKDDKGKEVASGIYFYQLKVGKFTQSKKMLLLK